MCCTLSPSLYLSLSFFLRVVSSLFGCFQHFLGTRNQSAGFLCPQTDPNASPLLFFSERDAVVVVIFAAVFVLFICLLAYSLALSFLFKCHLSGLTCVAFYDNICELYTPGLVMSVKMKVLSSSCCLSRSLACPFSISRSLSRCESLVKNDDCAALWRLVNVNFELSEICHNYFVFDLAADE